MAKCKYEPDFPERAEKFITEGHTQAECARFLGVSVPTFEEYKKKYPEFLNAVKSANRVLDDIVVNALYLKAIGFERVVNGQVRYYPPDLGAQVFWLKNRRPDEWRDKKEIEVPESLKVNFNWSKSNGNGKGKDS